MRLNREYIQLNKCSKNKTHMTRTPIMKLGWRNITHSRKHWLLTTISFMVQQMDQLKDFGHSLRVTKLISKSLFPRELHKKAQLLRQLLLQKKLKKSSLRSKQDLRLKPKELQKKKRLLLPRLRLKELHSRRQRKQELLQKKNRELLMKSLPLTRVIPDGNLSETNWLRRQSTRESKHLSRNSLKHTRNKEKVSIKPQPRSKKITKQLEPNYRTKKLKLFHSNKKFQMDSISFTKDKVFCKSNCWMSKTKKNSKKFSQRS